MNGELLREFAAPRLFVIAGHIVQGDLDRIVPADIDEELPRVGVRFRLDDGSGVIRSIH